MKLFNDLFGSEKEPTPTKYQFTTVPQAYRDATKAHKASDRELFDEICAILKYDKDPMGVIGYKTRMLNSSYGCGIKTFRERLALALGEDHLYSDDRLKRILDYKREADFPHTVDDETVFKVGQLNTLINYIKGKEGLWDQDSLDEKQEKYDLRQEFKKEDFVPVETRYDDLKPSGMSKDEVEELLKKQKEEIIAEMQSSMNKANIINRLYSEGKIDPATLAEWADKGIVDIGSEVSMERLAEIVRTSIEDIMSNLEKLNDELDYSIEDDERSPEEIEEAINLAIQAAVESKLGRESDDELTDEEATEKYIEDARRWYSKNVSKYHERGISGKNEIMAAFRVEYPFIDSYRLAGADNASAIRWCVWKMDPLRGSDDKDKYVRDEAGMKIPINSDKSKSPVLRPRKAFTALRVKDYMDIQGFLQNRNDNKLNKL